MRLAFLCIKMNVSRQFFQLLPQPLREVEVGLLRATVTATKNVARHVHFRACYIGQRSVQLASQRRNEIARQVAKIIVHCYSALKAKISFV